MLTLIKLLHTFVWAVMASATLYILYAGVTNTFNTTLVVSILLLTLETLVLLFNKWRCPLTPLAEKYTSERTSNFDIYLPRSLATYNKQIFGTLFIFGVLLVFCNWMQLP
jgi:hypothetical protein